ncbi:MAG: hypothetical protein CR997_07935 [Acidobacteria bacterium]|nr:MAG: hypothetical protein CR997_07935 [Acidobacteriota bacterium]
MSGAGVIISFLLWFQLLPANQSALEQLENDPRVRLLLKEATKFSDLSYDALDELAEGKTDSIESVLNYLYDCAHIVYSEALYLALKDKGLYHNGELEKKYHDRHIHLQSQLSKFKSEVAKNYDSKKYCGACAVLFYLGYRDQAMGRLFDSRIQRPDDMQVNGLLGLFYKISDLEKAVGKVLIDKLDETTDEVEKKKLFFKILYLRIYFGHGHLKKIYNRLQFKDSSWGKVYLDGLDRFEKLIEEKESKYAW